MFLRRPIAQQHQHKMNLNKEQLNDVRHAVAYYMYHHVSVNNPRYKEYEVILQLLSETKEETK